MKKIAFAIAALALAASAQAQNIDPAPSAPQVTYADLIEMRVPVTADDIADRPYRIVGEIQTEVKKTTLFSKSPSEAKVHKELWERAEKLGADAVVNARYGDARVIALSWGSRRATGQAVKFLTDDEIAALPAQEMQQ